MLTTDQNEENDTHSQAFFESGWILRNRMEVLLKRVQVEDDTIAEPVNATEVHKLAHHAEIINNHLEVNANENIEGLVIATPSALHASQTINALSVGKEGVSEKQKDRTTDELRQVVKTSKKEDAILAVDLSYRYTKAFRAIHEVIKSGEIGQIYAVNLVFHKACDPDKDWFYDVNQFRGGCVIDLGVHLIDMALYCLKFPEVKEVRSHLYNNGQKIYPAEEKVEDFAEVSMLTKNQTAINLNCSWHVSDGKEAVIEATFYGTEGGVSFKNVNNSFYDFKAEKHTGKQTEELVSPSDDWCERAGLFWAKNVLEGVGYNQISSSEYAKIAEVIDRIYGK